MWIGDVQQLPPVEGNSVFKPLNTLKKAAAIHGSKLWTGNLWTTRASLAVLMKVQYRMDDNLKDITEQFANGQQILQDALVLVERRIQRDAEDMQEVWLERFLHDSKLA